MQDLEIWALGDFFLLLESVVSVIESCELKSFSLSLFFSHPPFPNSELEFYMKKMNKKQGKK